MFFNSDFYPVGPLTSLRPVTLLQTLRKVLSLIVLERIRDPVENFVPPSQSAFRRYRSTADVVWCKRWLTSIIERKKKEIHILGIDLSRAFDTVNRNKLLQVITELVDEDAVRMIRLLLANTTLSVS